MDGCTTVINDTDLSIFDDIIENNITNSNNMYEVDEIGEEPKDTLIIMDQENIEYQVTLQGFWDNIQKRIWKSNHKLYQIDEKNYAVIIKESPEIISNKPPVFNVISQQRKRKTE